MKVNQPPYTCNYEREEIIVDIPKTLQVPDSPGLLGVSGNVGGKGTPLKDSQAAN